MKKYPAKLLLFGEYGLMFGAQALAIPFPRFSGYFAQSQVSDRTSAQAESLAELKKFAEWYRENRVGEKLNFPLNTDRLNEDLGDGMYFESDIPLQYGVGSSGALCAALFDNYSNFSEKYDTQCLELDLVSKLKADFVVMESYFHGRSSGLDPLVAFLNRPVWIVDGEIVLTDLVLDEQPWTVHLIDTGITSATSPLVKIFVGKMETEAFAESFHQHYLPANNRLIEAFKKNECDQFFSCLEQVHEFQKEHFREMLPDAQLPLIRDLKEQGILVKLLGSGGGGFLIAFAPRGVEFPDIKKSFRIF